MFSIPIIDDKEKSSDSIGRFGLYGDNLRMEVLIPHDKYKDELIIDRLMDRTEVYFKYFKNNLLDSS